MRMILRLTLVAALAFGASFLSTALSAADNPAAGYENYVQAVRPLEQQLFEKMSELDALYASGTRDDVGAKALIQEVAELKGKLHAVNMEYRYSMGGEAGRFSHGNGYGMHRGGGYCRMGYGEDGYRGHGGGHHGGR